MGPQGPRSSAYTPDLFEPGRRPARSPSTAGVEELDYGSEDPTTPELSPPPLRSRSDPFFDQPFREFEHGPGGIHLSDSVLWFDADRRRDLSFISSAHADFIGKNRRILATEQTVKILTRGTGRIDALTSPYRRSFALGPLQLEMFPAGRMLGSAQLLVERDQRRILYTNDFIMDRLATCERAKPTDCDVIAMPATYGRRIFGFPPREEVLEQIVDFVDRNFEEKATPVLLVPQLGTAQELMYGLRRRGIRIRAHRSIHDVSKVYAELGVNLLGAKRLQGQPARDEVVLIPPILRHDAQIKRLKRHRTALVSGRVVEPGYELRMRVDAGFPLAEAASYADTLEFVKACGAREVYLTSGPTEELTADLAETGLKVFPLVKPEQLSLL